MIYLRTSLLALHFIWLKNFIEPYQVGYVVIAERYLLDTIIDTLRMRKYRGLKDSKVLKFLMRYLLHFIPKKSLIIYLCADYTSLRKRYHLRKTPVEHPEWIEFQLLLDRFL
ncbi:MAG: hypothetical protein QXX41_14485 [Nitrososphaerota archaeon]